MKNLTALLALGLALLPSLPAHAFLVADESETVSVLTPFETHKGESLCTVATGNHVTILGTPSSPEHPAPAALVSVRVVDGPCAGHEASITRTLLSHPAGQ